MTDLVKVGDAIIVTGDPYVERVPPGSTGVVVDLGGGYVTVKVDDYVERWERDALWPFLLSEVAKVSPWRRLRRRVLNRKITRD